jgi:hypothetical protein
LEQNPDRSGKPHHRPEHYADAVNLHGIAFADLNDDGCQDVYIALGGAYAGDFVRNALFLNPGNTNRRFAGRLNGCRPWGEVLKPFLLVRIRTVGLSVWQFDPRAGLS